ncbi:hypothetical protein JOD26_001241 [Limosilactobacillus caviae]
MKKDRRIILRSFSQTTSLHNISNAVDLKITVQFQLISHYDYYH